MITSSPTQTRIPPLENGDCLTRTEFERRYAQDPHIHKAELIEGVVHVASPLRFQYHAEPHSRLHGWLWTYQVSTPLAWIGIEPTIRLGEDNELQPDIVLFLDEKAGGNVKIDNEGYLTGIPELVVEISASSASIDLNHKKKVYQQNGIPEYIVWSVFENELTWFQLQAGTYQIFRMDPDGIIRSHIFPGLWLDIQSLLDRKMDRVLHILNQGIQSPDHERFTKTLQ